MTILGITNRTENWKTAQKFAPFVRDGNIRLNLARKLGESSDTQQDDVRIELFWYGMRDYVHKLGKENEPNSEKLACIYKQCFSNLRKDIEKFGSFGDLKPLNYDVSDQRRKDGLKSNLVHTEIDIVLESSKHIFIGEAKDESRLGADGKNVLVHQLIRQYVMTKILLSLRVTEGCFKKKVIPFVVGDKTRLPSLKNTAQVKFMIRKGWLESKNVLSWDRIDEIAQARA